MKYENSYIARKGLHSWWERDWGSEVWGKWLLRCYKGFLASLMSKANVYEEHRWLQRKISARICSLFEGWIQGQTSNSFSLFQRLSIAQGLPKAVSISEISPELHACISNIYWTSPKECQKSPHTEQVQMLNTFILLFTGSQSLSDPSNIYSASSLCSALLYKLGIQWGTKLSKTSSTRRLYSSGVMQTRKR